MNHPRVSGRTIGPLVLGGNTFGWTSDETESFAVLDAFVGEGGRFIDTADAYSAWVPGHRGGESEEMIGRWLARRAGARDDVLIGTKVCRHPQFPGLSPANVVAAANASLARLQVDAIDVYYPHYDDPRLPVGEIAQVFHELQTAGKIRHVGLSNFTSARVAEWIAVATEEGFDPPVLLQAHYNLVFRRHYEESLAGFADKQGLVVTPYFSLASGFLAGKYRTREDVAASARGKFASRYLTPEAFAVVDAVLRIAEDRAVAPTTVALAWLHTRPNIAAPIASARTVEQLPDLMAAAALVLSLEEIQLLDSLSSRIGD